jgi:hypothetical protein
MQDDIIDVKAIWRESVVWIHMAQDTVRWWTLVNTVMTLRVT